MNEQVQWTDNGARYLIALKIPIRGELEIMCNGVLTHISGLFIEAVMIGGDRSIFPMHNILSVMPAVQG